MSQVQNLQQLMQQLSASARATAQQVDAFRPKIDNGIAQVQSAVGGSSTRIDANLIAALQQANEQLKITIGLLNQVAQHASAYGARL